MLRVGLPITVVVVAIAALVVAKVLTGSGAKSGPIASVAADQVVSAVTSVAAGTFNSVGSGSIVTPPTRIAGPPLTAQGKTRVLYIGAEYCPYCAAERWVVVAALARFGPFSNLGQTRSSAQDVFPSTATLSFHGAIYTSSAVSFTGVETTSNEVTNGGYATLDAPSAADRKLLETYDAPPYTSNKGSIPFVDIGNKYLIHGASFDPGVLKGKTHAQIAAALHDPNSGIAKAVDGTANVITAAICSTSADQPSAVCRAPGVTAARAKLPTK